jgi:hypothetical protein
MRHLVTTFCATLFALQLSAQDCKLIFTGTQASRQIGLSRLPDVQAKKVSNARLCLSSFPWTETQLKAIHEQRKFPSAAETRSLREQMRATAKLAGDAKVFDRFGSKADVKELAPLMSEPWFDKLSEPMKSYVVHIALGAKPADADNLATFFYYRALAAEGKFATIANDEVAKRVKLADVPSVKEITQVDDATYYSADLLRSFIYLHTIEARAKSTAKTAGQFLELLLAHDAAPHQALATLDHDQFTGRSGIEQRLVEALAAGGAVESKMLLGAHVTTEGADYYAQLNPNRSPRLIQYRKAEETIEILTGKDALAALENTIAADLTRANPDALTLANIMRNKKGYHVQLRDRVIEISEAEYKTIAAGKPLDDAHPLSQLLATQKPFVIYSNPLMRTAKYMSEAESLGFALQVAYPRVTILRDDYTPATDERAAQLHALGAARPADFVAVVDDGSFKVKDFKVLADIQKRLKDSGWNVVNYKPGTAWTQGTGKNVIVITGHIDDKLANFLRELGNAGYFRGNYVVLNTCYTAASTGLIAEINQAFGAHGCLRYEGKIAPDRVGELLTSVAKQSAEPQQMDSLPELMKKHLRTMDLRAIWVICRNESHDEART